MTFEGAEVEAYVTNKRDPFSSEGYWADLRYAVDIDKELLPLGEQGTAEVDVSFNRIWIKLAGPYSYHITKVKAVFDAIHGSGFYQVTFGFSEVNSSIGASTTAVIDSVLHPVTRLAVDQRIVLPLGLSI